MTGQVCDFCGKAFEWTQEQVALDSQLRASGSALGEMCDTCDDAIVQLEIKRKLRGDYD